MLRGMRKASANWLGRIVMAVVLGLIAISFAIWGIGDIFRGFGRSTVAKIGSTEITVEQFRQITNDPTFKSPTGQFDHARFEQIIRNAGFTEQRFTAEQKRLTMRREVADTISAELATPKAMADAQNRYDNEQRAIDYAVLDSGKAGDIPASTPEQIAKYYDEHKADFRAPEYRTVALI